MDRYLPPGGYPRPQLNAAANFNFRHLPRSVRDNSIAYGIWQSPAPFGMSPLEQGNFIFGHGYAPHKRRNAGGHTMEVGYQAWWAKGPGVYGCPRN